MAIRRRPSVVSAFASVDPTSGASRYRLTVRVPADAKVNPSQQPVRREGFHALLRPFHRFLQQGKPEIGRVHYVLLAPSKSLPPVVLGAWVLGNGRTTDEGGWIRPRRLIHFPGFGEGTFKYPPFASNRKRIPYWHHVTFEETAAGNVSSHPSSKVDDRGQKIHLFPTTPLKFKNAIGRHLGTAVVRQPRDLDVSGFAVMDSQVKGGYTSDTIEKKVCESIVSEHALIRFPYGSRWESDLYLRVNYAIIRGSLDDKEYPIRWKFDEFFASKVFLSYEAPPQYYEENLMKIPLFEDRSLLVAVSLFRGQPRWGSTWISPRAR